MTYKTSKEYIKERNEKRQVVSGRISSKTARTNALPIDFAAKSAEIAENYQKIMKNAKKAVKGGYIYSTNLTESERRAFSTTKPVEDTLNPNVIFRRRKSKIDVDSRVEQLRTSYNKIEIDFKDSNEKYIEDGNGGTYVVRTLGAAKQPMSVIEGNTPWPEDQEDIKAPLSEDDSLYDDIPDPVEDFGIYGNGD